METIETYDKEAASRSAQQPPLWFRRRPMQAFFGLVMLLGITVIVYPFIPLVLYQLQGVQTQAQLPYPSRLQQLPSLPSIDTKASPEQTTPPAARRLVIPKIGVDIAIVEGTSEYALLRGAWRIPGTSEGPATSNMVLSAHRFRYRPPHSETFYLLDKLEIGDVFIVYWDGEEYDYEVTEERIVEPTAGEILLPSSERKVTLFTCTPLFSTSHRHVIVGEPLET